VLIRYPKTVLRSLMDLDQKIRWNIKLLCALVLLKTFKNIYNNIFFSSNKQ